MKQSEDEVTCYLCQRNRPLFAREHDENIQTIPEGMLPPFVKELKKDLADKCDYLGFLHISTKFVTPCKCSDLNVHSYCMTARIIKN